MTLTISVIMFGFAKQVLQVRSLFVLRGDCRVPFKQGTPHTSTPYQYLTKRRIKKFFFKIYIHKNKENEGRDNSQRELATKLWMLIN